MKKFATIFVIVTMFLCTYASADMTIGFDDITTASWAAVPSDYDGLTWGGDWEVMSQTLYDSYPGTQGTFPSPAYAAYNGHDFGGNLLSFSGTPFTLDSLYASTFVGAAAASGTLTVTGYLGGSEVGSNTFTLSNIFAEYSPTFGLVDVVEFAGVSTTYYAYLVDDVTITPVPIPAAVLLGMLGLGTAGLKLRKRV